MDRSRLFLRVLLLRILLLAGILPAMVTASHAQETVDVAGSKAVVLKPGKPRASVILLPGGDGNIGVGANGTMTRLLGNQLVRTRQAYVAQGLAVMVADAGTDLAAAVSFMAAIKRPVTVIATSRGTLRAAQGITRGARPDALVLTAGLLTAESGSANNVQSILGSPNSLPPTLVIHHRRDSCRVTLPAGVDPFIRWAAGKARAVWVDGGTSVGPDCEARAYHGFNGVDGQVVAAAAAFRR
jgi:hypothetical protein